MANRGASVPKFGTWDSDNAAYTVYFQKVRDNKGATAPPLLHRPPSNPDEGVPRVVAPPPSRPTTSTGHRSHQHHHRAGSNISVASDPGGGRVHHHHRGASKAVEQSKFAPPPQFHPRQQPISHHSPGGGDDNNQPQQQASARSRTASPHDNKTPERCRQGRQRLSAVVPKFGVWDEQSASDAAQGFTVQFDALKRHRKMVRSTVPDFPRVPSPEIDAARSARLAPLVSRLFGCFTPQSRH